MSKIQQQQLFIQKDKIQTGGMKSQYFSVYNNFDLIQPNLQEKLQNLFTPQVLNTEFSYQQMLVYLDEQCPKFSKSHKNLQKSHSHEVDKSMHGSLHHSNNLSPDEFRKLYFRAERNVSKEIFENCDGRNSKVTPKQFIEKYIELLETAKLCVIRQQAKEQVLKNRLSEAKLSLREKTYVYIRLIQATVHSRYSDSPCFQYKLTPSSIPIITVVNSLNPVLDHEYTLQMDQNEFYIIFYESGIQIYKWKFSVDNFKSDGEYFKSIATEAVTFEVMVKMLPKKKSQQTGQLEYEIKAVQQKLVLAKKAFENLCYYMPFQEFTQPKHQVHDQNKGFFWKFTDSLFSFMPFLKHHVLSLHYVLIALIFVECLAAVSWAVQFIDLIIAFGLLGALYDRQKQNISMYLWAGLFALFLSTLKTIWGALLMPFGMPKYPLILVITIIFKALTLFFIWVCTVRADQISDQRKRDIYGIQTHEEKSQKQEEKPIFKANQNYYRNKKQSAIPHP